MKRGGLQFTALVLGLGVALPLAAEPGAPQLRFQHLSVEEGLSIARTYAVLKDSRGLLWVGTEDGLNRYDGSSIVVHRARLGDSHSLASSQVRALSEDDQKRLWVGAGGTLHLYDRRKDRFERYPLGSDAGRSAGLNIREIRSDGRGQVWVGTQQGAFRVDPKTVAATRFRHDPADAASLSHDGVVSLLLDRHRQLWVGTRQGLNRYDVETGRFVRLFQGADAPAWLRTVNIETMIEEADGALWIATVGEGLVRFLPETGAIRRYLPDPSVKNGIAGKRILSLAADGKGRLQVGVEDAGLDVFEPATGRVVHHRPDGDDRTSLSSTSVVQLRFDEPGILLAGRHSVWTEVRARDRAQRWARKSARARAPGGPSGHTLDRHRWRGARPLGPRGRPLHHLPARPASARQSGRRRGARAPRRHRSLHLGRHLGGRAGPVRPSHGPLRTLPEQERHHRLRLGDLRGQPGQTRPGDLRPRCPGIRHGVG